MALRLVHKSFPEVVYMEKISKYVKIDPERLIASVMPSSQPLCSERNVLEEGES